MNVEIGTEAPIFLFWEYLFQIFGILSLQCIPDSSGTDPGTTEQATEDVDNGQDDNVQVEAVTLLILHKQETYNGQDDNVQVEAILLLILQTGGFCTHEEQESKEHHATNVLL
jgi:hypothetical protein